MRLPARARSEWAIVPRSKTGRLLLGTILLLLIVIALGTVAFAVTERISTVEALYATLNTVTTVGRGMQDFSLRGKIIAMVIMVLGVLAATSALGLVTRAVVEGQIQQVFGRKRMAKQIGNLHNHVILCGYGRMGRVIARELANDSVPFVVIEKDEATFQAIEGDGFLGFLGDAASDETLLGCGITHARALICTTASDADNVFIALSARQLNPAVTVVARANADSAIEKLKRAGASRVFSPYRVGGRQMALAALRPNVIDFLADVGGVPGSESYQIEELRVEEGAAVCGRSLRELNLSRTLGVIVIGLRRAGRPMIYNPSADTQLTGNDIMIAIAPSSRLGELAGMVAAK